MRLARLAVSVSATKKWKGRKILYIKSLRPKPSESSRHRRRSGALGTAQYRMSSFAARMCVDSADGLIRTLKGSGRHLLARHTKQPEVRATREPYQRGRQFSPTDNIADQSTITAAPMHFGDEGAANRFRAARHDLRSAFRATSTSAVSGNINSCRSTAAAIIY